jgi:predicted DNA binding protein
LLELNERIRELSHDIVGADSRDEIARVACEGLVDIDDVSYAWVGQVNSATNELEQVADAGAGRHYLEEVSLRANATERTEPSVTAAVTGEPVAVVTNDEGMRSAAWRQAALGRDFLSVFSLPVQDTGAFSGVLSVYAETPGRFDEEARKLLEDLTDTLTVAFNNVQRRHSLLSDERIDLTYEISDVGCLFVDVAREQDCSCRLGSIVDQSDGSMLLRVLVASDDPAGTVATVRDHPRVRGAEVLKARDDGTLLEVQTSEAFVARTVADFGGRIVDLWTEGQAARLSVDVPREVDVRSFTERIAEQYPDSRLLSRQNADRRRTTPEETTDLARMLTSRQADTLRTAHEQGYFEWPREATGEQLAAEFDVAPATFHRHLRVALKKLLDETLDG